MSDTRNVKLGVCKAFFGGVDLGYTQGGVEVEVKTETHGVSVDQFGKTKINETIMGREVTVKVPMAETTLDNLVAIMPGATLTTNGVAATGTLTIATLPTTGQTVLVNGKTLTFKAATSLPTDVLIGATTAATATNLATTLTALSDAATNPATYVAAGSVVTVTYTTRGAVGNAFTIATGTAGAAVTTSGATLAGGVDGTTARVDVPVGIGLDLLASAKELRLHPKSRPDNDKSEDFVIPLANTAGSMQFAYMLEKERIYNCSFSGYPDSVTGRLFSVGA